MMLRVWGSEDGDSSCLRKASNGERNGYHNISLLMSVTIYDCTSHHFFVNSSDESLP